VEVQSNKLQPLSDTWFFQRQIQEPTNGELNAESKKQPKTPCFAFTFRPTLHFYHKIQPKMQPNPIDYPKFL
jgi:hypothetical protein